MADNASEFFRTEYTTRVNHIYQQRGGVLRGMVSEPVRFEGSEKAIFYDVGKSVGYETTAPRQLNTPSGQGVKKIEVSLKTFTVYEEIYEFDEDRMTVNEREKIYEAGAMAMGRTEDIEIAAAMAAAVSAAAVSSAGTDFSSGAFSAPAALTMLKILQQQHVPMDGNIFCALPAQAWNELLLNKVVNSADHVNRNDLPFMKATDSRFWSGINFFLYEEEDAGSIYPVVDQGDQDIFMWHRSAVGWAPHTDLTVKTQWHNEIDTLSINMKKKGAAKALRDPSLGPPGIVRARVRGTGTLTLV